MTLDAMERLEGIKIYDFDEEPHVAVNMTQVMRDIEDAAARGGEIVEASLDRETGEPDIAWSPGYSEAQVDRTFYEALNDPQNWVDMDNLPPDEGDDPSLYSFMRIDLSSGFIGKPPG
jgi:hypothetical protein